jgi:AAA domain
MPKLVEKLNVNGRAAPRSLLDDLIARQLRGTDPVEIADSSPSPEEKKIEAATMADAAKLVQGIKHLVRGWVPFGMVTGIVAEPGRGKSAFALYGLARPVVTGARWFTGAMGPACAGRALWLDTESTMAITIDRITRWKLPMERLILPWKDDPLKAVNLADAEHIARVESLIRKYRTKLVVIDSLRGGHDGDENNSRVGRILQTLAAIAERTHAAIVVVHHTKKLTVDEEITANSSRGSNAILALFRSLLGVDCPDHKSKWCRLRILKENLGLAPRPVGFLVTDKGLEFGAAPERPRQETETTVDRVQSWLRGQMQPGKWYRSKVLEEAAKPFGYSESAIYRARKALGIVMPDHVTKTPTGWEWRLPAEEFSKPPGET